VWAHSSYHIFLAIVTADRGVFRGGLTGARPPKFSKIVATRCQILRLKCTKFNFGWGSAPDPTGELIEITDNGMKV